MIERYMVDDAGTLIDMQTRDTYDYVSEICPILNEKEAEILHKLNIRLNDIILTEEEKTE